MFIKVHREAQRQIDNETNALGGGGGRHRGAPAKGLRDNIFKYYIFNTFFYENMHIV